MPRSHRLQRAAEHQRRIADDLEIGDKVEDPDQQSEGDPHRHPHESKSDRKVDGNDQRDQSLTTYVAIDVDIDHLPCLHGVAADLVGEEVIEPVDQHLIVEEDKEKVHHEEEDHGKAAHYPHSTREHIPARRGRLHQVVEDLLDLEVLEPHVEIEGISDIGTVLLRHHRQQHLRIGVARDQAPPLAYLVDHRGDDKGEEAPDDDQEEQHHQRDRPATLTNVPLPLEVVYQRHQHRSGNPGKDKGPEDHLE